MKGIENATITRTFLGIEDHGIMTAQLTLSGNGWGCGFGGYVFDEPIKDAQGRFLRRQGVAFGTEWIRRLLVALEVDSWEALVGKSVRVEFAGPGEGIDKIGHLIKNQWFAKDEVPKSLAEIGA